MNSLDIHNSSVIMRLLRWPYFPFVVLGVIVFLYHLPMKAGTSDDLWFVQTFSAPGFDPLAYSAMRYVQWTSRTLLEFLLMFSLSLPVILWKIIDTLVFVLIGVFLSKIIVKKSRYKANIVIASLILLFPYKDLNSAGWITTTVTYTWPLMFGLVAIYPLRKIADGRNIRIYEYIIYAFSLLIAANQEQMCFVILAVYASFTVYTIFRKRINAFVLVQLGLCFLSLAYILLCPGNAARSAAETTRWFPDYQYFSLLQKLESGVSACLSAMFLSNNWLLLALAFFVFFLVWKKYGSIFHRIVAAVPFLSVAALFVLGMYRSEYIPIGAIFNMAGPYGILNSQTVHSLFYVLALFGMLFVLCLLLISLYMLLGRSLDSLKVVGVIVIGLATKAVIGFSPTVWASLNRTGVYLMFSLIAGSVWLLDKWDYGDKSATQVLMAAAVLLGFFGGALNIFTTA